MPKNSPRRRAAIGYPMGILGPLRAEDPVLDLRSSIRLITNRLLTGTECRYDPADGSVHRSDWVHVPHFNLSQCFSFAVTKASVLSRGGRRRPESAMASSSRVRVPEGRACSLRHDPAVAGLSSVERGISCYCHSQRSMRNQHPAWFSGDVSFCSVD